MKIKINLFLINLYNLYILGFLLLIFDLYLNINQVKLHSVFLSYYFKKFLIIFLQINSHMNFLSNYHL